MIHGKESATISFALPIPTWYFTSAVGHELVSCYCKASISLAYHVHLRPLRKIASLLSIILTAAAACKTCLWERNLGRWRTGGCPLLVSLRVPVRSGAFCLEGSGDPGFVYSVSHPDPAVSTTHSFSSDLYE